MEKFAISSGFPNLNNFIAIIPYRRHFKLMLIWDKLGK